LFLTSQSSQQEQVPLYDPTVYELPHTVRELVRYAGGNGWSPPRVSERCTVSDLVRGRSDLEVALRQLAILQLVCVSFRDDPAFVHDIAPLSQ
jgi:hypothetical protein